MAAPETVILSEAGASAGKIRPFPKSAKRPASEAAPPREMRDRDSYATTALADITDRSLHAAVARFTLGLSPAALTYAYLHWATHLADQPGKRMQLVDKAVRKALRFSDHAARYLLSGGKTDPCIEPLPQDKRFAAAEWQRFPYN